MRWNILRDIDEDFSLPIDQISSIHAPQTPLRPIIADNSKHHIVPVFPFSNHVLTFLPHRQSRHWVFLYSDSSSSSSSSATSHPNPNFNQTCRPSSPGKQCQKPLILSTNGSEIKLVTPYDSAT
jgi:hypothetical protein